MEVISMTGITKIYVSKI